MLETLRKQVYAANMELPARGLVTYTWGNVSGIDRATGLVVIKPSGVPYEELTPANLVIVNLENGATVEGNLRPSSDVDTHLELYRQLPKLEKIAHLIDPTCFMIVSHVTEVSGRGFSLEKDYKEED